MTNILTRAKDTHLRCPVAIRPQASSKRDDRPKGKRGRQKDQMNGLVRRRPGPPSPQYRESRRYQGATPGKEPNEQP